MKQKAINHLFILSLDNVVLTDINGRKIKINYGRDDLNFCKMKFSRTIMKVCR